MISVLMTFSSLLIQILYKYFIRIYRFISEACDNRTYIVHIRNIFKKVLGYFLFRLAKSCFFYYLTNSF